MICSRGLIKRILEHLHGLRRRGMQVDTSTRVPGGMRLLLVLLLCTPVLAAPGASESYKVLVLHSFRNSLPVNADWYGGIVRGFSSEADRLVEIDIEAPDLNRFGDADYVSNLLEIYRHKYRDQKPHLIIPTYTPAYKFLLDYGEELFPGVPIVFCGADSRFVASRERAPHITGVTSHRDIAGTLELALQVHPGTQRVAVIVGSGIMDLQFEHDARQALEPFGERVEFMWLRGLPLAELIETVSKLPENTVILYLVQLQDRTGKTYIPINMLEDVSLASNAPVYGLWDTLLGHGIIGGRLMTMEDEGFQAARMGLRILRGEAPAAVPVADRQQNKAIFHGQELARWGIGEGKLPVGSHILHRQPSLWEEHRTEMIIAVSVAGLQGLLIFSLLLSRARLRRTQVELHDEHERRTQTQTVVDRLQGRLAIFSKERTLGAMITGIAHEINQPLIAIQNYAQAAGRRLQSHGDQTAKLNELTLKIEQQAGRAGDIIQHIRTLVSTNEVDIQPVSLNALVAEVIQMVEPEIQKQGCSIDFRPGSRLPEVLADALQIQLVLVNLLHNAMHSMEACEEKDDKVISVEISQINDRVQQVSVTDRGSGILPDRVDNIFEPFYSDTANGMGIGLAICRGIIDAHGGHIGYTPNLSGGAVFHFTLPVAAV